MYQHILFLGKSEQPTDIGWYYGRPKGVEKIEPCYVCEHPSRPYLVTRGLCALSAFEWFGPLPEIRASSQV